MILKHYFVKRFKSVRLISTDNVRVRFAPSPTGFLHLGGLRTAFYNYLFAFKNNGKFILRIEDTDQQRLVAGSIKALEDTLVWAGITPDEGPSFGGKYGPYLQSKRLHFYSEKVNYLLESNKAYRCFCSETRLKLLKKEAIKNRQIPKYDRKCYHLNKEEINEMLSKNTPFTIRLKIKEEPITFKDVIFGDVTMDLSLNESDPIIFKSDGFPTYHLANVVDDHYMNISHVLRGTEWLTSTPKHLMLYEAFNWQPPIYAHLPLIINSDGTKLSKRQSHITIQSCRDNGFYPLAILNYLTNLGGGFGLKEEDKITDINELANTFKLDNVNANNCKFEIERMKRYNRIFIHKMTQENMNSLIEELKSLLKENSITMNEFTDEKISKIIYWSKERIVSLNHLLSSEFIFIWKPPELTWKVEKIGSINDIDSVLDQFFKEIDKIFQDCNDESSIKKCILERINSFYKINCQSILSYKKFMKLLRLSLTNLQEGPPVAEIMELLGQNITSQYILLAKSYVNKQMKVSQVG